MSGSTKFIFVIVGCIFLLLITDKCSSDTPQDSVTFNDESKRVARYNATKAKFEEAISDRYNELVAHKTSENFEAAEGILGQFEYFQRTDYKDVTSIAKEVRLSAAILELNKISQADFKNLAATYAKLTKLAPDNNEYASQASKYGELWKERQIETDRLERAAAAERAKNEAHERAIEAQFSGWDGSHVGLEKIIKRTMNDPSSYKHVRTSYSDMGDYIVVQTTFRGTNAFGGVVTNSIRAKFSLDGTFLGLLE